jgi:hypothetical protein
MTGYQIQDPGTNFWVLSESQGRGVGTLVAHTRDVNAPRVVFQPLIFSLVIVPSALTFCWLAVHGTFTVLNLLWI